MHAFMSGPIVLVVLAGCCYALLGLSYKVADAHQCRMAAFMLVFSLTAGGLSAIISLFQQTAWGDYRLWLYGLAMGVTFNLCVPLLMRANRLGSAAVAWTIVNLSILLPILFAALVYREPLHAIDLLLLALFFAMLFLFALGTSASGDLAPAQTVPYWLCLLGVFLLNGSLLFCQKMTQQTFHGHSGAGVTTVFFLSCAVISLILYLTSRDRAALAPGERSAGLLAGASSGLGNICFLGASAIPAVIAFSVTQGLALLGGVLLTAVIYKERFNLLKSLGLVVGILVLVLAVTRTPLIAHLRHAPSPRLTVQEANTP